MFAFFADLKTTFDECEQKATKWNDEEDKDRRKFEIKNNGNIKGDEKYSKDRR